MSNDHSAAASWAICATVKEPHEVLERFVRHHQQLGVAEIFLFFHDPEDPELAWAQEQDRVTCIPCTEEYYREIGGPFQYTVDLQETNSFWALDRCDQHDWLFHLDADEHLTPHHDIGAYLASMDDDVASVRFLTLEAVWSTRQEASPFQQDYVRTRIPLHLHWLWGQSVLDRVYGEAGNYLGNGISGHAIGKSAVRVACRHTVELSNHYVDVSRPLRTVTTPTHHIGLIHYDIHSFEHFVHKFEGKLKTYEGRKGKFFRGKLYDIFVRLYEAQDEDGLRDLFEQMYVLDDKQIDLLRARNLIFPLDATTSQVTSPTFRALEIRSPGEAESEFLHEIGFHVTSWESPGKGTDVQPVSPEENTPPPPPATALPLPQALTSYVTDQGPPTHLFIETGDTTPEFLRLLASSDVRPPFLQTQVRDREEIKLLFEMGYRSFLLSDLQMLRHRPASFRTLRLDHELLWHVFPTTTLGPVNCATREFWVSYDEILSKWQTLTSQEGPLNFALHASQMEPRLLETKPPEIKIKRLPPLFTKLARPPVAIMSGAGASSLGFKFKRHFPWSYLFNLETEKEQLAKLRQQLERFQRVSHHPLALGQADAPANATSPATRSLDSFGQEHQLNFIDCMVLHATGSPLPTLEGASQYLHDQRLGTLMLRWPSETETNGRETLSQLWELLEQHGFALHQLGSQKSTTDPAVSVGWLTAEYIHRDYPNIRERQTA